MYFIVSMMMLFRWLSSFFILSFSLLARFFFGVLFKSISLLLEFGWRFVLLYKRG